MRKILSLFLAGPMLFSLAALAQHVTLSCIGPCGGTGAGPNCGYNFYRSADRGATYTLLNATPTTACRFVDASVLYNGASYNYYAQTVDPSFAPPNSASSNMTGATMPQTPPPDAMATFDSVLPAGTIVAPGPTTFTWANNPGQDVASYFLYIQELNGVNWTGVGQIAVAAGTTSASLSIPRNGAIINVSLRTLYTDGGTYGEQSVYYRETSPVGVPQILTPVEYSAPCTSSSGNVTFTWSNGPADTANYFLHAGTTPGGWDLANWNMGMINMATVPVLSQGPRIVWISVTAYSPTQGYISSDIYAGAYVACHSIT